VKPRFSIALISEDGDASWPGLKAIVTKLLRPFEDDGFTPRLEILPADDDVPRAMHKHWRTRSPNDQQAKRALIRYLARKISEPRGFVIFHYDGDEAWSQRTSKAQDAFDCEVRRRVEQVLATIPFKV
jgi:hypothetical protein